MEIEVLKEMVKKDGLKLAVTKNGMTGRIVVEFCTTEGKLRVQKSFQDTHFGRKSADEFARSIKTLKDLRKYLGLK